MELVNGVSLREMTERCGPLGPEAALAILKDALFELAAAHRRGVVHRDCAPENVFIDTAGNSKLADFGAAISWDGQTPDGTPLYLAPEQWQGAPESPAADLYAAAVVCFECLAGGPPFFGDVSQLMEQHLAEPMPLRAVDPRLHGLIGWGTAKHPADRPRSAIEFAAELESVATAGFGPDWERRGRWQLAELAEALLRDRYAGAGPAEPPGGARGGPKRQARGHRRGRGGRRGRPRGHRRRRHADRKQQPSGGHRPAAAAADGAGASAADRNDARLSDRRGADAGRANREPGLQPDHVARSQHVGCPRPDRSAYRSPFRLFPAVWFPASVPPRRPHRVVRPVVAAPSASSAPPAPSGSATASSPDQSLSVAGCASQATFQQGQSFSCPFTASGGLAPYNWTVTGLPTGLDTTDTGTTLTIVTEQGTGVNWGTYPITVTVTDSEPGFPPVTASQNLDLVVTPAS